MDRHRDRHRGRSSSRADRAREIALYRYALIRPLADPALSRLGAGQAGAPSWPPRCISGPFGEPVTVSRASLGPLDPGLALGRVRRPDPGRTAGAAAHRPGRAGAGRADLKREHPARTAAHIARIIAAEQGWAPSARTLQRHFARLELSTRPDGSPPKAFGRFEAAECDQLWVSDGLHGPIIDGRRAVLFALLDDHSRYVVGHRWGHGEDTLGMQAALHDAVKTHGCPQRLYCDNGSAYSSAQLAWSAAVLDIKLVHSAPGRPQGRGKIERWNRTVRDQFLVEVDPTRCTSLEELNRSFTVWLHQQYHRAVHSETEATPAQRYHAEGRARPPNRIRPGCAGRFCGVSSAR